MLPPSSTGLQVSVAGHVTSANCGTVYCTLRDPKADLRLHRLMQGIIGLRALSSLNMLRHAGCSLVLVTGKTTSRSPVQRIRHGAHLPLVARRLTRHGWVS